MVSYDEQFLARVFDSVTDPFAIYDREFKILRVNQALENLFRLSTQQIIEFYGARWKISSSHDI